MVATSGDDFGAEFLKSRTAKFYPTWSSAGFQVSARLQSCPCKDFTRVRRAGTKTARHYRAAYSLTGAKKSAVSIGSLFFTVATILGTALSTSMLAVRRMATT